MNSIDTYVDRALKKIRSKSDRELSRRLGLALGAVSNYRTRRAIPSPETMVKLAKLAHMDVRQALLELEFWRAASRNEHQAASQFKSMLDELYPEAA